MIYIKGVLIGRNKKQVITQCGKERVIRYCTIYKINAVASVICISRFVLHHHNLCRRIEKEL
jgi:hypothetical protein